MRWQKKGGIKLHMSIEEGVSLPRLYSISEAMVHDQKGMEKIEWKKECIYVMDRGYLNYEQFFRMNKEGIYFVSRLKENTTYKSIEEKDIPKNSNTGILDTENTIKIQIWCCLIAHLLMEVIFRKVKQKEKRRSFSHLVNFVRLHVISHIDLERYWQYGIEELIKMIRSLWERSPTREIQLSILFGEGA